LCFVQFHIRPTPCLDYISMIPPPLLPTLSKFALVLDSILNNSNPSKFFHYYSCARCNMVTFHVIKHSDLTIMVDNSRMIIVFEHCLCTMFVFQPSSLHISKDVLYDSNNFVPSVLY
jgi:hypothetical protein